MEYEMNELQALVDGLGYSMNDLEDIEILAACTGTSCQQSCQPSCQPGCSNKP